MARLIDADKIDIIFYDAQGHRGEYAQGYDDGVAYIVSKIDHAPTVDAVPVDWLREKMNTADDAGDLDCVDIISWILQEWQKEQEDEGCD